MQNLSLRLEQARKNARLTRDEVVQLAAQTSGFSRSSLQDWEQEDNTREPKIEYLFDLARIYNVHPWTLLSGESLAQINTVDALAINSLNLLNNANQPINLDFEFGITEHDDLADFLKVNSHLNGQRAVRAWAQTQLSLVDSDETEYERYRQLRRLFQQALQDFI